LELVTDGEFRRRSWWLELIMNWEGTSADRTGSTDLAWRNAKGVQQAFSRLWVNGPIRWRPSPAVRAFEFLKANTKVTPRSRCRRPS
jgi:methionine synthase II (cobalamin-independent)